MEGGVRLQRKIMRFTIFERENDWNQKNVFQVLQQSSNIGSTVPEANLEPCQTYMMNLFGKNSYWLFSVINFFIINDEIVFKKNAMACWYLEDE